MKSFVLYSPSILLAPMPKMFAWTDGQMDKGKSKCIPTPTPEGIKIMHNYVILLDDTVTNVTRLQLFYILRVLLFRRNICLQICNTHETHTYYSQKRR